MTAIAKIAALIKVGDFLDLENEPLALCPKCDDFNKWEFEYFIVEYIEHVSDSAISFVSTQDDEIVFPPNHTLIVDNGGE